VASCDGCPPGFDSIGSSCVTGCVSGTEHHCAKPGFDAVSVCGTSCPPGYHVAYSSPSWPCECGGPATLCVR
jgi:hypothetical protein